LIDAVKKQDVQAVRAHLKQKVDINATEADGFTALHWAAQRTICSSSSSCSWPAPTPRPRRRYNITPLYLAAMNGNAR
jgi:ankyrin repeat protein